MINLKEAYDLVLADLEQQSDLEERRKRIRRLMAAEGPSLPEAEESAGQPAGSSPGARSPNQFKYVQARLVDAVTDVLTSNGSAMASNDIAARVGDGGYPGSLSKLALHTCLGTGRKKGWFVEVARGKWDLASRYGSAHAKQPNGS